MVAKDILLAILGLAIVIWAMRSLWSPPGKHKNAGYRDQQEATHRALGGSAPPDPSDYAPPENTKK